MEDRRTFLRLAAALLPAGLGAQAPAPAGPRELARHTLTGPLDGFDVVLIELKPGPGTGRDHRHTGPVLGYVVDGQVRFGVNHGPEQIVAAGSTFFEPTGTLHSTFGSANGTPARVLAFMVVPKGNSGTVPA
jgi:quercetin dioxygenase-like cupin family protein